MHQILPHSLWVGHADDARDFRKVFDQGIKALVQVAMEEPAEQPPRELIYCRFPLIDGAGNEVDVLQLAVTTVSALLQRHVPTLIACGAGLSRSPAIAAAALALAHQETPEESLQKVAAHSRCDVSGLWKEV